MSRELRRGKEAVNRDATQCSTRQAPPAHPQEQMLYLRKDLSTQPQNWAVHKRGEWRRVVRFHHLSSVARRPRAPEPRPRRARAAHNAAQGSWRVKLYQLNDDGQWDDHGTGHAVVQDVQARPTRPRPTPLSLAARARGVGARPSPRSRDGARARAGESGAPPPPRARCPL